MGPHQVSLWLLDGVSPRTPQLLDVTTGKASSSPPNPYDLMGIFAGRIGNFKNNQATVPFKGGVINVMSAGDAYLKMTERGGAINYALPKKASKFFGFAILGSCGAFVLATTVLVVSLLFSERNR